MFGTSLSTSGKAVNTRESQKKSPARVKGFNVMAVKAMDTSRQNVPPISRSRGEDFLYAGLMIQKVSMRVNLTKM